jgi:hypothetical protein
VVLHAGDLVRRRWLANGKGFFSAEEPVLHFALPAGRTADKLEVRWPTAPSRSTRRPPWVT